MEYFKKVYAITPDTIEIGAPLSLIEIAIIKDTIDNEVLLRNVVVNNSNDSVIAFAINYSVKSVFGELITDTESVQNYVYQDIEIKPGEIFGNKISISLPSEARQVFVEIEKVVFNDGNIWVSNRDNIVTTQPQRELKASDDFLNTLDNNSIIPRYYYVENESCWQCTCGQPNIITTTECYKCARLKQDVKQLYNNDIIEKNFLSYLSSKKVEETKLIQEGQKEPDVSDQNDPSVNSEELVLDDIILNSNTNVIDNKDNTDSKVRAIHSDSAIPKWHTSNMIKIVIVSIIILALATGVFTNRSSKANSTKISPYIDLVGQEIKDNNLTISQELYDEINKVFLCGYYGTISATSTIYHPNISDDGVVSAITWTSNSALTKSDYTKFIKIFKRQYTPKKELKIVSENDNTCIATDGDLQIKISIADNKVSVKWALENEEETSVTNSTDSDNYQKPSGKSYNSSSSYSDKSYHTCIQCGKRANHSITGLNGTLEWYCDDHWNQMREMLDYMSK